MRPLALMAAALAVAGCGVFDEPPCDVNTDLAGIALPDSMIGDQSTNATLRVGETVQVCMIGNNDCMYSDQRFEFHSDAPEVVTATAEPVSLAECNELFESHLYPATAVSVGRLTAVGAGTAHVQAVLLRAGSVEKTAGLIWCSPSGPGSGCRPIAAVVVSP